ncbi:MAG: hypothetical protein IT318_02260 [Anaerolineales bacterium]|nr:hypothetical protein [Anaerolineales bacterium]
MGDVDEAALQQLDLPEWEQDALREADRIEAGFGLRYLRVPPGDSRAGYADMEIFIATLRSERLREQLWRAVAGRGAFRRFKDVPSDHPGERWFTFKQGRLRERVLAWLASQGIETVEDDGPADQTPETSLASASRFIIEARSLCRSRRVFRRRLKSARVFR